MQYTSVLIAYIGPETIVPATSALAAIGGVALAFGRSLFRPVFWLFGKKGSEESKSEENPNPEETAETEAQEA